MGEEAVSESTEEMTDSTTQYNDIEHTLVRVRATCPTRVLYVLAADIRGTCSEVE